MVVRGAGMSLEDYGQHRGVTGLTLGCHQEVLDVTGGHWNGVEWELNGTELSLWRHWDALQMLGSTEMSLGGCWQDPRGTKKCWRCRDSAEKQYGVSGGAVGWH